MILNIESDIHLDIEKINLFFKLFSLETDKINIKLIKLKMKSNVDKLYTNKIQNLKTETKNTFFFNLQNYNSLTVDESIYIITIFQQKIQSFFGLKKMKDIHSLYEHIAYHFGYTPCLCKGFSVKDTNKNKINVEEFIYIKNSINFSIPKTLIYLNPKKTSKTLNFEKLKSINFVTESKIISTLLQSSEMLFYSDNKIYKLKINPNQLIEFDNKELSFFDIINNKKELYINNFLNEHTKEDLNLIKVLYLDKNYIEFKKKSIELKKLIDKNKNLFWSFINEVPNFNDVRDKFTTFIIKQYNKSKQIIKNKRKGIYLELSEDKIVERMFGGSLKYFLYKNKKI